MDSETELIQAEARTHMRLDNVDLTILTELNKHKKVDLGFSGYGISQLIYPSIKNSEELKSKSATIKQRLSKLEKYGLIASKKDEDETRYFRINCKNVVFCKKFIVPVNGKQIGFDNMVLLKCNGVHWEFLQLRVEI